MTRDEAVKVLQGMSDFVEVTDIYVEIFGVEFVYDTEIGTFITLEEAGEDDDWEESDEWNDEHGSTEPEFKAI